MTTPSLTRFRHCSICGVLKPHTSEFFGILRGRVGARCRVCNKLHCRAWRLGLPLVTAKKHDGPKRCTACYQVKPLDAFHYAKTGIGGRNSVCAECRAAPSFGGKVRAKLPSHLKWCPGCSQAQLLDAFSKCSTWKDGLATYCKTCASERKRRDREKRPGHTLMLELQSRERNREAKRVRDRLYYQNNREAVIAQMREHYAENAEFYRQRMRQYRKDNPEATRVRERNNRVRRDGAPGSHTFDETWQMLEDQDGLCAYCEIPLFGNYQVDHMVPIVRGGSNDWSNLAIACAPCNGSKHASTAEEFMERLRRGL